MPLDPSIYQNVNAAQPVPLQNPMDVAQKAMSMAQLGMQYQQQARQMQTQSAIQSAYMRNTDPVTGQLDKQGVLSELGRTNPMAAQQVGDQFTAQGKAQAEAQTAQVNAHDQIVNHIKPMMDYIANAPADQKAAIYDYAMKDWKDKGIPTQNMTPTFDEGHFNQVHQIVNAQVEHSKAFLDNQKTQAETAKTQADTILAGPKASAALSADLYGSRSPNAELTSQYDKQAQPVRSSQQAMQQMIDNFHNTTPQGDASLVLNAFKIKFPTAPDVNSLAELQHSQSATDQMKNWVSEKMDGVKDPETRANLMRDGISTFRANAEGLDATRGKYQAKARNENVPGADDITAEPAIDKTRTLANKLQDQLGPYTPPSQRPGGMLGSVGKMLGMGGPQSANAKNAPQTPAGMILMRAPSGKLKYVPESQKGEAIAAGGSVVK